MTSTDDLIARLVAIRYGGQFGDWFERERGSGPARMDGVVDTISPQMYILWSAYEDK